MKTVIVTSHNLNEMLELINRANEQLKELTATLEKINKFVPDIKIERGTGNSSLLT